MADIDLRAVRAEHDRRHPGFGGALTEEWTEEEHEFTIQVDRYKRVNHRPFPTLTELLAILLSLGYRRRAAVAPPLVADEAAAAERLEERRRRCRRGVSARPAGERGRG